ncbi:hypothetical protein JCM8547_004791 [Rhodosporidiobolus lusitaniae]
MHSKLIRVLGFALCATLVLAADDDSDSSSTRTTGIDGYIPRKALSFLGIACYGGTALFQWVQWVRCGRQNYMLPLLLGMTFMAGGFGVRVYYADKWDSLTVYIGMTMLILLSPCAFLAQDYMLLHRLADALGEDVARKCLFIRSTWITKLFVASDVFTFFLQAGGGGMSAQASMAETGQKIALVGLFIQLACFLVFCALLVWFYYKARASYSHLRYPSRPFSWSTFGFFSTEPIHDWRALAWVMALTCIGIIIRSIFRLIEYAQGHDGALKTTEAWFYLLDALPLWISMTLFAIIWPPRVLEGVEQEAADEALQPQVRYDRHAAWSRVDGGEEEVGMRKFRSGETY